MDYSWKLSFRDSFTAFVEPNYGHKISGTTGEVQGLC